MKRILFIGSILGLLLAGRLAGQQTDELGDVYVNLFPRIVWGNTTTSSAGFNCYSWQGATATVSGTGTTPGSYTDIGRKGVRFIPGVTYSVVFTGSKDNSLPGYGAVGYRLSAYAPPGYTVEMKLDTDPYPIKARQQFDGSFTNTAGGSYAATLLVRVVASAADPGLGAGMATSLRPGWTPWLMSLGASANGNSAGTLSFGFKSGFTSLASNFTRANLNCDATTSDVLLLGDAADVNVLRQVIAPQVCVDISGALTSGTITLNCYHPSQRSTNVDSNTGYYTFSGSPYAVYTVTPGTSDSVGTTINWAVHDASTTTVSSTVTRTFTTKLTRSGSQPNYTWTAEAWHLGTMAPVVTKRVRTGAAETLDVRDGSGVVAITKARTYTSMLGEEEITSETVGTGSDRVTTTSSYYDTASNSAVYFGWLKAQHDTDAAGTANNGWRAFEYASNGTMHVVHTPWLDSVSTGFPTGDTAVKTSTDFAYDAWNIPSRPTAVSVTTNGTQTAQSSTTYTTTTPFSSYSSTHSSLQVVQAVQTVNSASTSTLQTTTKYFIENAGDQVTYYSPLTAASDDFYRGLPYSIKRPDNTMQAFVYQRGTWNGSTFTPSANAGLDSGTCSRSIVITGTSSTTGTAACPLENSCPMETIRLVSGKSTREVTIRDKYADVVRTETYVWTGSAWSATPITYATYTYTLAHQLATRTGSNGGQYTATYSGERKLTETDESGLTVTYVTYDDADRVTKVSKPTSGSNTVWDIYVYDAAGHVLQDTHDASNSSALISYATYDDAGRIKTETPAGIAAANAITHTYDPTNQAHTITLPDGATKVETAQADGRLVSLTGTAVVSEYYSYSVDPSTNPGFATTTVHLGSANSPRFRSVTTDWLGRTTHAEHPSYNGNTYVEDNAYSTSTGQLLRTSHTGAAPTRFDYDPMGRCNRVCLDYNNNGALEPASTDRISDSDEYIEQIGSAWWATKAAWTYPTSGSATPSPKAYTRRRLTGFPTNRLEEVQTTDIDGNTSTRTVDVNRSAATLTITTSATGLVNANVETVVNGLSTTVTTPDSLTYSTTYDAFGRPTVKTDSRSNTTTIAYVSAKPFVYSVTDGAGNPTYFGYDVSGRRNLVTDALGKKSRVEYDLLGRVIHQWGDTGYPVAYEYDPNYGERTKLKTYRGGTGWTGSTWPSDTAAGTADTTTWAYEPASGLLTSKQDALNRTVDYTYTAAGQTYTRTWGRHIGNNPANARVKSTYAYDWRTGELTSVTYNDGTPSLGYSYTRLGQLNTVTDATGQRTFAYDTAKPWHLESEDFDTGTGQTTFYGKRVLNRLYDEDKTATTYGSYTIGKVAGRTVGFDLADPSGTSELRQEFTYSNLGRFVGVHSTVGTAARDFVYQYLPNAPLVSGYTNGGGYTVTFGYDTNRNLRTSVEGKWGTTSLARFDFKFDQLGRRRWSKQSGSAFADYTTGTSYGAVYNYYTYNDRGEVETSAMYRGDNPPDTAPADTDELPGRRFEYRYDNLGNRKTAGETGHAEGGDDVYQTNELNQYTSKENNTVRVLGTAAPGASVALGSPVSLVAKRDRTYAADVLPGNASPNAAAGGSVTVRAALPGTTDLLGSVTHQWTVGPQTATLNYDEDGNLLSDGVWTYVYDAENRLIQMTSVNLTGYLHKVLYFKYDYLNRRVEKKTVDVDANTTVVRRYLYDGWALLAELDDGATPAIQRSYTWGLDLAGSLDATGGVGALLRVTNYSGGSTSSYFPAYDGNGNIVALVSVSSGGIAATYEYGPFGEVLRAQGSAVDTNPFRFSTKFTDTESGLVYYGARYYSPSLGRFINRDPIAEQGGLNLYGFCGNDGINGIDYLGNSLWDYINPFSGKNPLNPLSNKNLRLAAMLPHYSNPLYWIAPKFYRKTAPAVDSFVVGSVVSYFAGPEAGGAAAGFVSGFESSILNGGSLSTSLKQGAIGAAIGFTVAAIFDGVATAFNQSASSGTQAGVGGSVDGSIGSSSSSDLGGTAGPGRIFARTVSDAATDPDVVRLEPYIVTFGRDSAGEAFIMGPTGKAIITSAVASASAMVGRALQDVQAAIKAGQASPAYQSNFGNYDPARAQNVEANLKAIQAKLGDPNLHFRSLLRSSPDYLWGKGGSDDVIAWVSRGADPNMVNLQSSFWSRSAVDRAITLVHEVSHLAAGTIDYGYGVATIQQWAQMVPMSAIRNAESYGQYAGAFP